LHRLLACTAFVTPVPPPPVLPPVPPPVPQVSLASDFMWNLNSREANASFGYDYLLRQCRLRGRVDTGGCAVVW
jgi:hypothetical protein